LESFSKKIMFSTLHYSVLCIMITNVEAIANFFYTGSEYHSVVNVVAVIRKEDFFL
jgi:hypothetical protein